jgi:F-type H+-transporting ATPase subunit epsilon
MADTVEFELVSPAKLLKSEPVEMVVVPGAEGDLGVLPGHSALIATVRPGVIDIHEGGSVKERIFVAGGFCEISPERCTVLAEEAIEVSAIDKVVAQKRLEDATLAWKNADDANKVKAEAERRIAEAMVAAAV